MLYHITNIQSFESIVSNHQNGNLEFWLSHYLDMNDAHELEQFFKYENDDNTIKFAPAVCTDYYILSLTENPQLTFNHIHGDYGNVIMCLELNPNTLLHNGITFRKCAYKDEDTTIPQIANPIDRIVYSFLDRMERLYIKRTVWEHEEEWRLVLNQQQEEPLYPPRQGKQYGYLKRQFPHEILKKVYVRADSIDIISDVQNILRRNNYSIPTEILQYL